MKQTKSVQVHIRLTPEERQVVEAAAVKEQRSLSRFIIMAAMASAKRK